MFLDYTIARAQATGQSLALCFLDLTKAFDTVPRDKMMEVLVQHYKVHPDLVEIVRRMYI